MKYHIALAAWLLCAAGAPAADLFVSPAGNDADPGTPDRPLASLSGARDAVRRLKRVEPAADYRVLFRGGTYRLKETVVFGLEDSAAAGHTITYAAADHERPVFSGGVPITAWRKPAVAPRELPAAARRQVWVADVPASLPHFHALYDGGRRLPRAHSAEFLPGDRLPHIKTAVSLPHNLAESLAGATGAELFIIPEFPWTMNIVPLSPVDEKTGIAATAFPGTYGLTAPRWYLKRGGCSTIEGAAALLDKPGEWVLDSQTGKLYLWPLGEKPGSTIVAPRLTELVRVEGAIDYNGPVDTPVRGLIFRGLTFTEAERYTWRADHVGHGLQHDWEMFDEPTAMLRFRGAEDCRVEACRLTDSAAGAIRLDLHCRRNQIVGNLIEHVGGVGILLAGYGPGTKDVNRENEVLNNHIHHVGCDYWASAGIFVWQSGSNHIAHNLIHDTPYTALVISGRIQMDPSGKRECSRTVRWREIDADRERAAAAGHASSRRVYLHGRDNVVEYNDIHDTMQRLFDGNAIYVSGTGTGNQIRDNFVHDCPSSHIEGAIRCDDDQVGTTIEGNLITRIGGFGHGIVIKCRNDVKNNIIADLRPVNQVRGYLSLEEGPLDGAVIEHNILYATQKMRPPVWEQPGNKVYPPARFSTCRADRNIYFNTADPDWGAGHLARQRGTGIEAHSVAADPLFVDAPHGDYRLRPDSPALRLGFSQVDYRRCGPRDDLPYWQPNKNQTAAR